MSDNYFPAFFDDEDLITICKVLPLCKDMKIVILDKIIDYIIEVEHTEMLQYHHWDDNFHTGYPEYDPDWYYSD